MTDIQMNYDALSRLLADFYAVTGQRIGIFDYRFNILIEHPRTQPDLPKIRSYPEGARKCYACDIRGMKESASSGKTYTYAAMPDCWKCAVRIIEEEGIAGFLMFGQVLYDRNLERQQ